MYSVYCYLVRSGASSEIYIQRTSLYGVNTEQMRHDGAYRKINSGQ